MTIELPKPELPRLTIWVDDVGQVKLNCNQGERVAAKLMLLVLGSLVDQALTRGPRSPIVMADGSSAPRTGD